MTHPIPDAALSQHIAILGKTGSGKTYAAKGVVEIILDGGTTETSVRLTAAGALALGEALTQAGNVAVRA